MPGVFGTLLGLRNVTQRTNLRDAEQLASLLLALDSSDKPQDHKSLQSPSFGGSRLSLGRSTRGC